VEGFVQGRGGRGAAGRRGDAVLRRRGAGDGSPLARGVGVRGLSLGARAQVVRPHAGGRGPARNAFRVRGDHAAVDFRRARHGGAPRMARGARAASGRRGETRRHDHRAALGRRPSVVGRGAGGRRAPGVRCDRRGERSPRHGSASVAAHRAGASPRGVVGASDSRPGFRMARGRSSLPQRGAVARRRTVGGRDGLRDGDGELARARGAEGCRGQGAHTGSLSAQRFDGSFQRGNGSVVLGASGRLGDQPRPRHRRSGRRDGGRAGDGGEASGDPVARRPEAGRPARRPCRSRSRKGESRSRRTCPAPTPARSCFRC
jgi:hypothetical protein